jgi:predicted transcriptional regulator YheO
MGSKKRNRDILKRFIPMADMIVATFGSKCEVVIHDLENIQASLIYINGSVTGRELGAPTTEVILKELRRRGDDVQDIHGQTSQTGDGKFIKTSTSFIRNDEGKVIGFIGVNFDITAFSMVNQIISEFSTANELNHIPETMNESYAHNIEEVFENMIDNTLFETDVPIDELSRDEKIAVIKTLDEKGAFLIQGSVERVAEILGVTKQTIYNYLEVIRTEPN